MSGHTSPLAILQKALDDKHVDPVRHRGNAEYEALAQVETLVAAAHELIRRYDEFRASEATDEATDQLDKALAPFVSGEQTGKDTQ